MATLFLSLCRLSVLACLLLLAGCSPYIDAEYGHRVGLTAQSVNGTAVLADMFQKAGHNVSTWGSLSPKLRKRADCIVWIPNDFTPPNRKTVDWLEAWLAAQPDRTLVYVGRDFDAAPSYWNAILPDAPDEWKGKIRKHGKLAESRFLSERKQAANSQSCDWFTFRGTPQPGPVRSLEGDPEWIAGIDAAQVGIELNGRLIPANDAEPLVKSGDDVLVSRIEKEQSQILLIANGSFLLNLPLVNHEHRKLAGRLVNAVGPPRKRVVFLESGAGGPPIREKDPDLEMPTGLEGMVVWPRLLIFLHFALAGILFCFWRFPIFGRPREPDRDSPSDFGTHIQAVADLLSRSGDRLYAWSRVNHFREMVGSGGKQDAEKEDKMTTPY